MPCAYFGQKCTKLTCNDYNWVKLLKLIRFVTNHSLSLKYDVKPSQQKQKYNFTYRAQFLLFRQDLLCAIFSHDQNITQKTICLVNKYQKAPIIL